LIAGRVTDEGVPEIPLTIAGAVWTAIVDTGFNGDLELPARLKDSVDARPVGSITSLLAGGQSLVEDNFQIRIPFDGQLINAQATFVDAEEVLIGTRLLRDYHLTIDFPAGTLLLERVETTP
jgi:predicted aspartyl protease